MLYDTSMPTSAAIVGNALAKSIPYSDTAETGKLHAPRIPRSPQFAPGLHWDWNGWKVRRIIQRSSLQAMNASYTMVRLSSPAVKAYSQVIRPNNTRLI